MYAVLDMSVCFMLSSLSHHLADVGGHYLNDRRWLLGLPLLQCLFLGHRPRLRGVNNRAGGFCCFQHLQRLADHSYLLGHIVGLA